MEKKTEAIGFVACGLLIATLSIFAIVSEENNVTCQHTNLVFKADEYEHWQECSECQKEIPNSRKGHLFSYGHCDCGL